MSAYRAVGVKELLDDDELRLVQRGDPFVGIRELVQEVAPHHVEQLNIAGITTRFPLNQGIKDFAHVNRRIFLFRDGE